MHYADLLALAHRHARGNANAEFCLREALAAHARGDYGAMRRWATKSLAYSVGIFHADYQAVTA